jgi:hypothetical protein
VVFHDFGCEIGVTKAISDVIINNNELNSKFKLLNPVGSLFIMEKI